MYNPASKTIAVNFPNQVSMLARSNSDSQLSVRSSADNYSLTFSLEFLHVSCVGSVVTIRPTIHFLSATKRTMCHPLRENLSRRDFAVKLFDWSFTHHRSTSYQVNTGKYLPGILINITETNSLSVKSGLWKMLRETYNLHAMLEILEVLLFSHIRHYVHSREQEEVRVSGYLRFLFFIRRGSITGLRKHPRDMSTVYRFLSYALHISLFAFFSSEEAIERSTKYKGRAWKKAAQVSKKVHHTTNRINSAMAN
uniref:Uncharacterized protein n=1 Tax=Glossina pallidipes TaxID=7398 RepID=A0A1B0A7F6_GLOPL